MHDAHDNPRGGDAFAQEGQQGDWQQAYGYDQPDATPSWQQPPQQQYQQQQPQPQQQQQADRNADAPRPEREPDVWEIRERRDARRRHALLAVASAFAVATVIACAVIYRVNPALVGAAPPRVADTTAPAEGDGPRETKVNATSARQFVADPVVAEADIRCARALQADFQGEWLASFAGEGPWGDVAADERPGMPSALIPSLSSSGEWPGAGSGWDGSGGIASMREVVRAVRICESEAERQRGGTWTVLGCEFGDDGSLSRAHLLCSGGDLSGCVAIATYDEGSGTVRTDGIEQCKERISRVREMRTRVERLPMLANHQFVLAADRQAALGESPLSSVTVLLLADDHEATLQPSFDDRETCLRFADDIRTELGVESVELIVADGTGRIALSAGGIVTGETLKEAQGLLYATNLDLDTQSLDARKRAISREGEPARMACDGERHLTQADAEAALGQSLQLPHDINSTRCYSWETAGDAGQRSVAARYGSRGLVRCVACVVPEGCPAERYELSVPTVGDGSPDGNRVLRSDAVGDIQVHDLAFGTTISWRQDGSGMTCMAHLNRRPGEMPPDDATLTQMAEQIRVVPRGLSLAGAN